MAQIKDIYAREILDSRGNPTIEVELTLENDIKTIASVPSGASTGKREALELRDGTDRYMGLGVLKAIYNVNTVIKDALIDRDLNQKQLDTIMIELDGTDNKSKLGANAMLAVSMAFLKACAKEENKDVYNYLGGTVLPYPMMNILNGGMHADNDLTFQEFMIVPMHENIKERIRIGSEVFHHLKKILRDNNYNTNVGDEGGFAPNLRNNEEALNMIMKAIKKSGYDVKIAIDIAASTLYKNGYYCVDNKKLNIDELISYYEKLINKYPIISLEDPVDENDWDGFVKITEKLGNKIQIVGDDLFVTNKKYLKKGIDLKAGNAILIKPNQIGTVSEMLETIYLAKNNNYKTIISHRSGETEDTVIADLAVGLNLGQIKTGSLSRTDRICKYNRLLKIEEDL